MLSIVLIQSAYATKPEWKNRCMSYIYTLYIYIYIYIYNYTYLFTTPKPFGVKLRDIIYHNLPKIIGLCKWKFVLAIQPISSSPHVELCRYNLQSTKRIPRSNFQRSTMSKCSCRVTSNYHCNLEWVSKSLTINLSFCALDNKQLYNIINNLPSNRTSLSNPIINHQQNTSTLTVNPIWFPSLPFGC